jgi:acyl-CoA synthetase (AMP-forming)/AMP-acid ligase II
VPLKVPVIRMRHADTASRLSGNEIGDFLDEPHGRAVGKQIDCGTTCNHTRTDFIILAVMSTSEVAERFREVCRDAPAAVAVRTLADGRTMTFDELLGDCGVMGRALTALGVSRGATVVSVVGNHPVFFSLIVACMDAGAALVPLGEATDAEAAALVRLAGACAVVTDRALPVPAVRETSLGGCIRILRLADVSDPSQYGESVVLKLTSGSTDLPKAAIASERHLINDGRHVIDAMGIAPGDVNLACIPLSHSYAIGNLIMPLLWQGTGVALRPSFNPSHFVHDVAVTGATVFPGVPFMFDHIRALPQIDHLPDSLRLLITAGAPVDQGTVRWFLDQFDRKVHSFYGSSETGGIAYDDSDEIADPPHVGRPMPETTIAIRRPVTGATEGRIFVKGTAVASGYAGSDAARQPSAFRKGGFLTGDLGHLDDQGRLVLTGRVSALVNVAGRKVDPTEVERTLSGLPGIVDARVLGISCEKRGQQLAAFVIRADSSLTPIAIRQFCAATLSTHKIPRRFVFLDRFPVDGRGKIDRRALQALLSSAAER